MKYILAFYSWFQIYSLIGGLWKEQVAHIIDKKKC